MNSQQPSVLNDEGMQYVEWRARVLEAVLLHKHDDVVLFALVKAGLRQAESDAMNYAAKFCEDVAAGASHSEAKRLGGLLARGIRAMDKANQHAEDGV